MMNDGSRQHRADSQGCFSTAGYGSDCRLRRWLSSHRTARAGGTRRLGNGTEWLATAPSRSSTSAPAGHRARRSAAGPAAPDPARRPTYAISAHRRAAGGRLTGQLTARAQGVGRDSFDFGCWPTPTARPAIFHLSGTTVTASSPSRSSPGPCSPRPGRRKATTVEMRFRYTMQKGKNSGERWFA